MVSFLTHIFSFLSKRGLTCGAVYSLYYDHLTWLHKIQYPTIRVVYAEYVIILCTKQNYFAFSLFLMLTIILVLSWIVIWHWLGLPDSWNMGWYDHDVLCGPFISQMLGEPCIALNRKQEVTKNFIRKNLKMSNHAVHWHVFDQL